MRRSTRLRRARRETSTETLDASEMSGAANASDAIETIESTDAKRGPEAIVKDDVAMPTAQRQTVAVLSSTNTAVPDGAKTT